MPCRRRRALSCFAVLCGLLAMTCMVTPVAAQSLITFESLQEQLTEQAERIAELEALQSEAMLNYDAAAFKDVQLLSDGLEQPSPIPVPDSNSQIPISQIPASEYSSSQIQTTQIPASQFLESPSTESLRQTTGRLHLDYWAFPADSPGINQIETGDPRDPPKDRFELRRIRVGVRGSVPPQNVTYQLDLEFAGVDQIGIRDAWIGLDELPLLDTIRIGNQKRPYGLDQLNSSNFTVFAERALMLEAVNDLNRRVGIQSFGVSEGEWLNWRYGAFNMQPIDETGFVSSNSYQVELAGRLATTLRRNCSECRYLHLGVSTSFGFPNEEVSQTTAVYRSRPESRSVSRWLDTGRIGGVTASQLLGFESVWNYGALQVGGEYLNVWLNRGSEADLHFQGGYVYVSLFLTGEHMRWNRKMGIVDRIEPNQDWDVGRRRRHAGFGAWQIAIRGSVADLNDHDIMGGKGESITTALNWYWNAHSRMQINYVIGEVQDRERATGVGTTELLSGNYQIIGTRFMVDY